jgi:hypothetical protein
MDRGNNRALRAHESLTLFKLITGELLIGSLAAAVSSCRARRVECCHYFLRSITW